MRVNLVTFLLLAGTVVGCASNPPPAPPPMAMAPEPAPAPAPMMSGPADGVYKGMAELAADAPRRCHKMTATQTVHVRHGAFMLGGMRGKVGPDGGVMAPARHGMSLAGTVNNGTLDVTTMSRGCGYHYSLTRA